MKPIIGLTVEPRHDPADGRSGGSLTLNWNYPEVVARAGGVPLMIPPMADMEEVARLIDGWLIPGGYDIDASRFGEENHPKVELQDPSRFDSEARLYRAIPDDLPVLGICYGCQFLNVVRGGSLIQHLPDAVGHEGHVGGTLETYAVDTSSNLAQAAGGSLSGKSYHHQAVGKVGKGLKITATAGDGTVEALEASDRPWMIGVQWHPERSPDDDANQKLILEFVARAKAYAEARRR